MNRLPSLALLALASAVGLSASTSAQTAPDRELSLRRDGQAQTGLRDLEIAAGMPLGAAGVVMAVTGAPQDEAGKPTPGPSGDQPELYLVMNLIRAYLEPVSGKDGYKVKSGDVTYKFTGDIEIRVWDERDIRRNVIGTYIVYALKKGGNKGITDKPANFDVTFDKDKVKIEEPKDTYGTGNEHVLERLAARFEELVLTAVKDGREAEIKGLAKWGAETTVTPYYVQKVLEARGRKHEPIKFQIVDAKKLEEARKAAEKK